MDDNRLDEIKNWARRDRDITALVRATLTATGADTLDALLADQPDVFGEMHASLQAMIEDIPIHEPPGWSR